MTYIFAVDGLFDFIAMVGLLLVTAGINGRFAMQWQSSMTEG